MEKPRERIAWIDETRGLALLAMILHHIAFNLIYLVEIPAEWLARFLEGGAFRALQLLFVAVFLGLSGICSHLSRRPFLRAGRVALGALAVTVVTYFVFPDDVIWFGVLHCIAFCMAFFALFGKYIKKIPPVWGAAFCLALFVLTYRLPDGYILSYALPPSFYRGGILTILGFSDAFYSSMDYVPLLPHFFLFAAGFFLGSLRLPEGGGKLPCLAFCGRHSLSIYLLHQPILFAVFFLIEKIIEG